jgi:hydrogenase expression/formation protein HypC
MCLAIPAKIIEIKTGNMALVESEGVIKEISLAMIEHPEIGEYVIIHVGFALNRIDQEEALKTLDLIEEIGRMNRHDRS